MRRSPTASVKGGRPGCLFGAATTCACEPAGRQRAAQGTIDGLVTRIALSDGCREIQSVSAS